MSETPVVSEHPLVVLGLVVSIWAIWAFWVRGVVNTCREKELSVIIVIIIIIVIIVIIVITVTIDIIVIIVIIIIIVIIVIIVITMYMFVVSGHLYRPLPLSQPCGFKVKIKDSFGTRPRRY